MPLGYGYTLSALADEFSRRLPLDEQRRLGVVFRSLAHDPFRPGNYTTKDDCDRIVQNLLIDDWVITYWPDHAVRELRIAEIAQV